MTSVTLVVAIVCLFVLSAYEHNPYGSGPNWRSGAAGFGTEDRVSGRLGQSGRGAPPPQQQGSSNRLPAPEPYVNPDCAVAFAARGTHDQFFYKSGPLVFDDVITNLGGGYSAEYGVFTAPVPGIYAVNYHASSNPNVNKPAHVDLLRNNREVINSAMGNGASGTPANSALLYLDQFDTVTVNGRRGTAVGCEANGLCTHNIVLVKMGKFTDQKLAKDFPMDKW